MSNQLQSLGFFLINALKVTLVFSLKYEEHTEGLNYNEFGRWFAEGTRTLRYELCGVGRGLRARNTLCFMCICCIMIHKLGLTCYAGPSC